ncbi:MAG: RluA family pseudouridine synthase [Clostridia bacterium]|nr:RluA family pseudouridine synthase [Clostridia bacterium]
MNRIIEHIIEKECILRDFLRNRYTGRRIHFLREKGHILLNGRPVTVVERARTGDKLSLIFSEELTFDYPPQDMGLKEIYSDEDVLVVYKPCGVPSMPAAPHFDGNLFNGLRYLYPEGVFRVVTRLDKDTSGLVLVAKNALAHSILHEDIRLICKTYTALVEGELPPCDIDAPICTGEGAARYVGEGGKPSKTRIIATKPYKNYTIASIRTETGRTHQIRVHLAHVGHPIVGDGLYGRGRAGGQLLACTGIAFKHPISQKNAEFYIDGEAEILERLGHVSAKK